MLEICVIIAICLFGGQIYLSIKDSNESRRLNSRKVKALEMIAVELSFIRRIMNDK